MLLKLISPAFFKNLKLHMWFTCVVHLTFLWNGNVLIIFISFTIFYNHNFIG